MLLSLLLASLSFGQSTDTVKETLRLDNIAVSVRELQSGRPVLTGTPELKGGAKVSTLTISGAFYSSGTFSVEGQVKISTGFVINFPSTLAKSGAWTTNIPAGTVAGSTQTLTVLGSTVSCHFTGSAFLDASDTPYIWMNMDGTNIPFSNSSNSIPTISCGIAYGGTGSANCSGSVEFQVTPGQHTFYLNVGSASGNITFPFRAPAQFGCREVNSR